MTKEVYVAYVVQELGFTLPAPAHVEAAAGQMYDNHINVYRAPALLKLRLDMGVE